MNRNFSHQLAQLLVTYSAPVKNNDFFVIRASSTDAAELCDALQATVLKHGGYPHIDVKLSNSEEILLTYGSSEQLRRANPVELALAQHANVFYRIVAPTNTAQLGGVLSEKITWREQGLSEWYQLYRQRRDSGAIQRTVTLFPTEASAQQAGMGLLAYQDFVYRAYALHEADPNFYWTELAERQTHYINWLNQKSKINVVGPAIDLEFSCQGRHWVSAHGKINMPDGEIYISPVENSIQGRVKFNFPSVYRGQTVAGVELIFENGELISITAEKGQDYLLSRLAIDEGARCLGEFAIGTNEHIQQFTGNTLFDEKIGGTIHMALGNSYVETGGQNKSNVHWDMVHDMRNDSKIYADDELFYESGKFLFNDRQA